LIQRTVTLIADRSVLVWHSARLGLALNGALEPVTWCFTATGVLSARAGCRARGAPLGIAGGGRGDTGGDHGRRDRSRCSLHHGPDV